MRADIFISLVVPLLGRLALGYEVQTPPLDTDWTYKVGTDPWPEYPRPQLQRENWQSLNGIWNWKSSDGTSGAPPVGQDYDGDILIPSCIESGLSGVQQQNLTYVWLATEFEVSKKYGNSSEQVLINFEAVDYEATVYINGQEAGFHRGGYWRFSVDATPFLKSGVNTLSEPRLFRARFDTNTLVRHVHVFDPTDVGFPMIFPFSLFMPYSLCTAIYRFPL